jgi:magnesium chelatase family protein
MIAKIYSVVVAWLDGQLVEVEVDIHNGMPAFIIVGLPDTAIQESRERIRSAIKNSDLPFPRTKITVNLAPADIKKAWPSFDLPIALGILQEECKIHQAMLDETLIVWELALDGLVRSVQAVLPTVIFAKEKWYKRVIVPEENAVEAALIPGVDIVPAKNIAEIVQMFSGSIPIKIQPPSSIDDIATHNPHELVDFSQIVGQQYAKRALLIAAAGWHNILMEWPPGSGKTMLSKALGTIMPPMVYEEIVEVSKIYSVAGKLTKEHPLITDRPFRKIHHTASSISIIWGGRDSKPGEISLAHKWVLFLDEMLEFPQSVLETLRQPLEDGVISINRVQSSCIYPARFMLVGAMNPCPCGFMGDTVKRCTCQPFQIERYRSRLSGPLLDRIDMFIHVPRVSVDEIASRGNLTPSSAEIRIQVIQARERQVMRLAGTKKTCNAEMNNKDIDQFCVLSSETNELLQKAVARLDLSTRAYYRTLKLARTIADLAGSENICAEHITEALGYREKNTK